MPDEVREILVRELELDEGDVIAIEGPLDLSGLWALYALERPELKDETWVPQTQAVLTRTDPPADLFRILQAGDVLVHHPYDSFATSVAEFVDQASRDPNVLAIKQTLYRTGSSESRIVESLIRAAESGKQVVVLVELKARFDEEVNVERARELETAGVHVVYGLVGLKTHTKVLLVVRDERTGIRRYCHVGTGNYNPVTANLYEDFGLLTADPEIGADVTELFNSLTGYSRELPCRQLLVAPNGLREAIVERIERQAALGPDGRIVLKMNTLVDPKTIDALYDTSRAGTPIDLLIRGVCCLRPGVPGQSETIRVRSLLGRFLEHSRIYRFGPDADTAEYLIGSADLMPRNLDRRVEALVPVRAPALRRRLGEVLDIELADDTQVWELAADGIWHRLENRHGVDAHEVLMERADRAQYRDPRMSRPAVEVRAAGGIVRRAHARGAEILVVHRPAYDDWSLPKGKLDPGEDDAEAAVREVLEETGVRAEITGDAGTVEYRDHRDRSKVVRYFTMTATDVRPRDPDDEVDLVVWWSPEHAARELTYAHDRDLVRRALP